MHEALLHFIWQQALWDQKELTALSGEKIKIIHQGMLNTDAGPDFTNAKIEIDNTLWAGNVEIHQKASDWYKHSHHTNAAYNNVILHVVLEGKEECLTEAGRSVPNLQLNISPNLQETYSQLQQSHHKIPCWQSLPSINIQKASFWFSALAVDRLHAKTKEIENLLASTQNNWEESFYIQLCRNFGLKINKLPFELFARSLSHKIIQQQPNDSLRLQALLFGQAGFLEDEPQDDFEAKLQKEYRYQKQKYKLKAIEKHLWKFLRTRPLNFPTVRLAQLAALLKKGNTLFSHILSFENTTEVVEYFSCQLDTYWEKHYTFGKESAARNKKLGEGSIQLIIINTIVPFMFLYGKNKNKPELMDRAIRWLEELPAEKNHLTKSWSQLGIKARHAADSQAIIQLNTHYCSSRNCLNCQIGHLILKPRQHEA